MNYKPILCKYFFTFNVKHAFKQKVEKFYIHLHTGFIISVKGVQLKVHILFIMKYQLRVCLKFNFKISS